MLNETFFSSNWQIKVLEGNAHLTIGGYILAKERTLLFSTSNPYLQASIGFCFKETDKTVSLMRLAAPFNTQVWCISGTFVMVSMITILLTKMMSNKWRHFFIGGRLNRTPIMNMWNSLLGNPISNQQIAHGRRFANFARALTILWIILWFVMRQMYQALLYTHLSSNQLSSPYDTIEKIRNSDCKIIGTTAAYNILIKDFVNRDRYSYEIGYTWIVILIMAFYYCRVIFIGNSFVSGLYALYDLNIEGVAVSSDLSQKTFNLKNSPKRRLAFTKDRLFMYSPVFLFRKKSALVNVFDKQLQTLRETGLIEFWIKNYIDERKMTSKQKEPKPLRIDNILAAFQICGVLYLISFVVFILELISAKYRHIKQILDYFTY